MRREFKENGLIQIERVHLLNTIVHLTKIEFIKRSNNKFEVMRTLFLKIVMNHK